MPDQGITYINMRYKRSITGGNLFKGVTQLGAASVITRVLGMVNRMYLSRLIGAEGLGLYQMIIPLYIVLAVAVSLGLPGAVTKMVADRHAISDPAGQYRIQKLALNFTLPAALLISALLWAVLCFPLKFIPDSRIFPGLRLMPAAFIFVAFSSILRSYFQGRSEMFPLAASQLGEQVVRIAVGLAAACRLLPLGLEYAVLGLVAGIAAGEACGLGVLILAGRCRPRPVLKRLPFKTTCYLKREMFTLALPLLVFRLSAAVTGAVESWIIPSRLQIAGFSSGQATSLFGQFSGMALPLLFLPTVLIVPLNMALVPAVAGAVALNLPGRLYRLISISLAATAITGGLTWLILTPFARVLVQILYGHTEAVPIVIMLAPLAPLAFLQFTTASILHGLGRPGVAVANDLTGTALSLAIIYYLTASPAYGIAGVIWGYGAAFSLITLLNMAAIYVNTGKIDPLSPGA